MADRENDNGDLIAQVKKVHRAFPTGVTIVTTMEGELPFGLAVNAFSSVSLSPPMVLACINETSSTYPRFFGSRKFGVSILANDQEGVAMQFAKSGGDKFAEIDWHRGVNGVPLISDAAANLELEVVSMLMAGTHTIFIGQVLSADASGKASLIYSGGGFYDGAKLSPTTEN
ncbi:flavin reductase family protein [Psychromarinibacter sp. C21-152]|uniref:Flavin reductase family protein n=1 Tax=Psychromarinibacter sediminicola TaxID=3033385 RepID=A0AAE3NP86_9RHOB|nr:flavin reductase family protein [Psychromarinibacter sediminicola]MDF0600988.1 flavin reductase family protein [Psychromarinibacter sediminicola]